MRELRPPAVASCFPWRELRPPYLVPSREAIDQGEGANPSCPMAGSLLVVATTVGSLLGPLLEHQPHAHTSTSTQTQAPTQIHTRTQTRAHTYASTHTNIHTKRTHTQRTPHFVGAEAIMHICMYMYIYTSPNRKFFPLECTPAWGAQWGSAGSGNPLESDTHGISLALGVS